MGRDYTTEEQDRIEFQIETVQIALNQAIEEFHDILRHHIATPVLLSLLQALGDEALQKEELAVMLMHYASVQDPDGFYKDLQATIKRACMVSFLTGHKLGGVGFKDERFKGICDCHDAEGNEE